MERKYALLSVESNIENPNTIKHMLATEAVMKALAVRLGEDEDEWGIVGLIHDVDVELTEDDPASHSTLGADMARDMGANENVAKAILCHNQMHGIACVTPMEKALYCTDPLTGLITASVMIRPDQKIAGLTLDSLKKRYDEKRFAAGANRDQIALCTALGIELDDFLSLGLTAMQAAVDQLGL
jgi:putative nucleotidyltransferase with HDIG domain